MFVDLRDAADSRSSRSADVFSRDGNRRRNAFDALCSRLVELLQELPRVSRETLDVPPLPLRIKRVEGETRLAAAANAAKGDQPPMWQIEVNVLEIVHSDAAKADHRRRAILRHGGPCYRKRAIGKQISLPRDG